ncbi:acyltransferase family protein [Agromyces intestinalis]|uniref:acyltransferase family protein n=1 Tax=Agromyces intestinalis TaxID=2592652 RepID=UPI001FEB1F73|nr:acyltransferase [Agromyces intestinalis]
MGSPTTVPSESGSGESGSGEPVSNEPGSRHPVAPVAPAGRDLVIDLARVTAVVLVVIIHLLMIGVGFDATGAIVMSRPLEAQAGFAGATWIGQIMPLFFVAGGFTGLVAWRSLVRRGGDWVDFVRGRTLRLGPPTLPLFVFFAVAIGAATASGVDPAMLAYVAAGTGSPLWFLAAFLLAQVLVPLMARLHEHTPGATMAVLAAGAIVVDLARIATGIVDIGLVNLLFVWLFVQQLGFWYRDGWFFRRRALTLVALAAGAWLLIAPPVVAGWYSADMLVNLNPPTVPLMLLGIAQASLLAALHRPLDAFMRTRPVQAVAYVVGSRAMTIYLWHLPVIIAVMGLTLVIPGAAPEPASVAWWLTRPIVFIVVAAIVLGISMWLVRFERVPTAILEGRRRPGAAAVVVAAVLAFIPTFLVMEFFLDLRIAIVGVVLGVGSRLLLRPRRTAIDGAAQAATGRAG